MAYPPCSTPPTERPSCSVCGEAAVSRCDECSPDGKLFLCSQAECFDKMHNAFNAAKHQQLLVPWDSRKKWTPKCCATHTNKLLEYWCDLCRVPVCTLCLSHGEHVGHETSLASDVCQALQQDLQAKAEQLDAEIERGSGRLAQLARLRDEAGRREGSVGAAMRALDEAEKQFGDKMRALRAELEASAVSWHDRAQKEHEELAARMADVRALAENLRASCNEEEAQRVAVEYNEQCKQREALRVPLPSLVGCEVGVPPDALTALQAAVVGLVVTSDGVVSCATCKQEGRESSMQVCGCEQKACSALCVAACLTCVKVEKDALPLALQHKVVPEEAQRVVVGYNKQCKQREALRVPLPSLVGCEVEVPPDALTAQQAAVTGLAVTSDGVVSCATCKQEGRESSMQVCGCEQKACSALCVAACLTCVKVEKDALPLALQHKVALPNVTPESQFILAAETCKAIAEVWRGVENRDEELRLLLKARVILESQAPNSLELAETYNGLGWAVAHQHNFSDAQTWFEKARVIYEDNAPNSIVLAETYNGLGFVFRRHDNRSEAQTWYEKARVIYEDNAPNSIEVAQTYSGLGCVFRQQHNFSEAQTWYEKARVILESKAPNSLELAHTYYGLGWTSDPQDNFSEAQTWYGKARVIYEDNAPNSIELADTYCCLGSVFRLQDNHSEAQTWFEKARVILESKAPNSLELAEAHNSLGSAFRLQNNFSEAQTWYEKARVILESQAPKGLELAETYDNLGGLFAQQGNFNEAQTWYEKARVIYEKAPNSIELDIVLGETYCCLGSVFCQQNNFSEAQTWYEKARVLLESKAPNSLQLATVCNCLGSVFRQQDNFSEAQTWYDNARVILESQEPNGLVLADTYNGLGAVFRLEENFSEAETWYEKARVILESKAPNSLEFTETLVHP